MFVYMFFFFLIFYFGGREEKREKKKTRGNACPYNERRQQYERREDGSRALELVGVRGDDGDDDEGLLVVEMVVVGVDGFVDGRGSRGVEGLETTTEKGGDESGEEEDDEGEGDAEHEDGEGGAGDHPDEAAHLVTEGMLLVGGLFWSLGGQTVRLGGGGLQGLVVVVRVVRMGTLVAGLAVVCAGEHVVGMSGGPVHGTAERTEGRLKRGKSAVQDVAKHALGGTTHGGGRWLRVG